MKTRLHIAALCLLCAACAASVGCKNVTSPLRATIPYVENILDGGEPEVTGLLECNHEPSPRGAIVLIGNTSSCNAFADRFAARDVRDNASGSSTPDGLADFAGEKLICIADDAAPESLEDSLAQAGFRLRTVRKAIAALDTTAHMSRYDHQGMLAKSPAKIIIFGDPRMSEYGAFDVDTLFHCSACNVMMVSPLDLMLEKVFSPRRGKATNIAIIADLSRSDRMMYEAAFTRTAAHYGAYGSQCFIYSCCNGSESSTDGTLLESLLDSYSAQHPQDSLDALIINNLTIDVESVKTDLADMISVMSEKSYKYGRHFSKDFRLLEGFSCVADWCYAALRDKNLFTHDIAPLQTEHYTVADVDDSIILIPATYVQD